MKFCRVLLVPFLFTFSYQAQAAINPGSDPDQGGELILSVWDDATHSSYTLDLGITTRDFCEMRTYVWDLSMDQLWMDFKTGAESMRWDVAGSDRDTTNIQGSSLNGFMTTARIGEDISVTALQYGVYNTMQNNIEQYVNILNLNDEDYATNHNHFFAGEIYAGNTSVWGSFAGNVNFASAEYGDELEFWHLTTAVEIDNNTGRLYRSAEHTKMNTWILRDNKLIYATAIPVPAAVWLFGSALAGLVGVARRKRS